MDISDNPPSDPLSPSLRRSSRSRKANPAYLASGDVTTKSTHFDDEFVDFVQVDSDDDYEPNPKKKSTTGKKRGRKPKNASQSVALTSRTISVEHTHSVSTGLDELSDCELVDDPNVLLNFQQQRQQCQSRTQRKPSLLTHQPQPVFISVPARVAQPRYQSTPTPVPVPVVPPPPQKIIRYETVMTGKFGNRKPVVRSVTSYVQSTSEERVAGEVSRSHSHKIGHNHISQSGLIGTNVHVNRANSMTSAVVSSNHREAGNAIVNEYARAQQNGQYSTSATTNSELDHILANIVPPHQNRALFGYNLSRTSWCEEDDDCVFVKITEINCKKEHKRPERIYKFEHEIEPLQPSVPIPTQSLVPETSSSPPTAHSQTVPTQTQQGCQVTADDEDDMMDDVVFVHSRQTLPQHQWPHFRHDCPYLAFTERPRNEKLNHCSCCYCYICDAPVAECAHWIDHSLCYPCDLDTASRKRFQAAKKSVYRQHNVSINDPQRSSSQLRGLHVSANSTWSLDIRRHAELMKTHLIDVTPMIQKYFDE